MPATRTPPVGDEAGGLGAARGCSWSARKRSRRSVASASTVKRTTVASAAVIRRSRPPTAGRPPARTRWRARRAPQVTAMSATLNVGQRYDADADVEEVHHAARAADAVDQVADARRPPPGRSASWRNRSPGSAERDSELSTNTATTANAEEDPAGERPEVQPERRALVVDQAQLEPVADHRDARHAREVRLGGGLGDQVEHDHHGGRHGEEAPFSGAWHPLPSPCLDAEPRVRQRVEPLERDRLPRLLAHAVLLRASCTAC